MGPPGFFDYRCLPDSGFVAVPPRDLIRLQPDVRHRVGEQEAEHTCAGMTNPFKAACQPRAPEYFLMDYHLRPGLVKTVTARRDLFMGRQRADQAAV